MDTSSPRISWLTDIHLNFLQGPDVRAFLESVTARRFDMVVITGDIGEADSIETYLRLIARILDCPVYFVLGNHDFYRVSFAGVRKTVRALCREIPQLVWLEDGAVVTIASQTALVGCDGWADGREGDFWHSDVELLDFHLIDELRDLDQATRIRRLNELGDAAAARMAEILPRALAGHRHVILLTHVPPFREAAWYAGRESNALYLPFFCCRAAGETLRAIMAAHPDHRLTVLCGHTHGAGICHPAPNITVHTGGAVYGRPEVQPVEVVSA